MEVHPRTQTVQLEALCWWGPSGVMAAAARGDRLSVRTQLLVWACAAGCEAPCWAHSFQPPCTRQCIGGHCTFAVGGLSHPLLLRESQPGLPAPPKRYCLSPSGCLSQNPTDLGRLQTADVSLP